MTWVFFDVLHSGRGDHSGTGDHSGAISLLLLAMFSRCFWLDHCFFIMLQIFCVTHRARSMLIPCDSFYLIGLSRIVWIEFFLLPYE